MESFSTKGLGGQPAGGLNGIGLSTNLLENAGSHIIPKKVKFAPKFLLILNAKLTLGVKWFIMDGVAWLASCCTH